MPHPQLTNDTKPWPSSNKLIIGLAVSIAAIAGFLIADEWLARAKHENTMAILEANQRRHAAAAKNAMMGADILQKIRTLILAGYLSEEHTASFIEQLNKATDAADYVKVAELWSSLQSGAFLSPTEEQNEPVKQPYVQTNDDKILSVLTEIQFINEFVGRDSTLSLAQKKSVIDRVNAMAAENLTNPAPYREIREKLQYRFQHLTY